jgi:hypothetical protein
VQLKIAAGDWKRVPAIQLHEGREHNHA